MIKLTTDRELKTEIANDFISRLYLPPVKPTKSFLLATMGIPGSGRTTIAHLIVEIITGSVLVSANSVRYLIKEIFSPKVGYNIGWGENVRDVLREVSDRLLREGYSVVFDGNSIDPKDRQNITQIVEPFGIPARYLDIDINVNLAKEREKDKYDNPNWISSFEEYRVNTTEKMLISIDERDEVHKTMGSIPGLVGTIDNNGLIEDLLPQVEEIATAL